MEEPESITGSRTSTSPGLPQDEIEYRGREDRQLEYDGFRIDLTDIESVLRRHRAVAQALVVKGRLGRDEGLVAYCVPAPEFSATDHELWCYLRVRRADFRAPMAFVWLAELPSLRRGKVDTSNLPAPACIIPPTPAARSIIEKELAAIWSEILQVDHVDAADNFFDLKGHSLLATHVLSRIARAFQVELPLQAVFEKPVLADLAREIERAVGNEQSSAVPVIGRVPRQQALPLSFAQRRLWFLDQSTAGCVAYTITSCVRLQGPIRPELLQRALNGIIRRHEALRTCFSCVEGEPVQVIAPALPIDLPVAAVAGESVEDRLDEGKRIAQEEAARPFDLTTGPLLRAKLLQVAPEDHLLVINVHHIVSDAWSLNVFWREMRVLYEAFLHGRVSPLPELAVQYADVAVWQREQLTPLRLDPHLAYWREQLGDSVPVLELPTDRPRPPVATYNGADCWVDLPESLTRGIEDLARAEGVTPYIALLAVFQVLLHCHTGLDEIVVGSAIAGRQCVQTEDLIGFFVNTLVLRTDLSGAPTFRALLHRVRKVVLEAYEHQDVPFEKLVEDLQPRRDPSRTPLFQVIFGLRHAPAGEVWGGDVRVEYLFVPHQTAKFDLTLDIVQKPDQLAAVANYNTDVLEAAQVTRLLDQFQILLAAIVADPEAPIDELPVLTAAERHRILVEWNDTKADYPRDKCLQELITEQARRTPQAAAVVHGDRALTYEELEEDSNRLAHYLRRLGVKPGVLVGLCVESSPEMVTGLLGILKSGAAYVPLDPNYPSDRLALVLDEAAVSIVVGVERLAPPAVRQRRTVFLDSQGTEIRRENPDGPAPWATPNDLIYVIFTSGSTGKPKGAGARHHSFVNLVHWYATAFGLTSKDRVLLLSSPSFDLTQKNIFAPLMVGAQLHLLPLPYYEPRAILQTMDRERITWINCTPTAFYPLVDPAQEDWWTGLASLRYVFLGGEPIALSRLRPWIAAGGGQTTVVNTYGPTECTDVSAFYSIPSPLTFPGADVPIGRPIPNSRLFVLNANRSPVPPGVQGELYIGGVPVGSGYVGNAELTAQCFLPDPFGGEGLLYRTGDLAQYLPDGNLRLCGRIDQQVKIRGFRIELGEIEQTLAKYPGVREAVVAAAADRPGDEHLVAYLVMRSQQRPTSRDLREFLGGRLPSHMIPSAFTLLDHLPLTPSGKVDRRALQTVRTFCAEMHGPFVAPRTPVEQTLAAIWAELLGIEQIGVHDNIFELGGHSLLMVKAISRIRNALGIEVSIRQLFDAPTIADLAAGLARREAGGVPADAVAGAPAGEDQLPEGDVNRPLTGERSLGATVRVEGVRAPAPASEGTEPQGRGRRERPPAGQPAVKIQSLVFPTAGRVDSLRECMGSFLRNCQEHGRQCDCIVADDGANPAACRQMLQELQRDNHVRVLYAGPQEKRRFADELVKTCGLPAEVVDFGLFDVEKTGVSTGANRNALVLATIGDAVFSADDDTRCVPSLDSRAREDVALAVDRDPADLWVFPDRATALRQASGYLERDFLADHERFLGQSTRTLVDERIGGDGPGVPERVKDRLRHVDSRILVTLNGLLGDCGLNSPFSYLLWTGPSHDRLVQSEEIYRRACTSREVLRVVDRPTVSDATFVMSTFMGLDNRALLPPFMPVMRGQDHVFGLTVWQGLGHGWFAHLPVALVHQPAPVRQFRPGETIRGATGLSTFRVMLECIRSACPGETASCDASRLQALGSHVMSLGRLSPEEFDHLLRQWVQSSSRRFVASLRERLCAETAAPRFWVSDLEKYMGLLEQAVASEEYYVPLDLLAGSHLDEARRLMHRLVFRFGQLLYWWPSLVEAARDLRRRDYRLPRPVEEAAHD